MQFGQRLNYKYRIGKDWGGLAHRRPRRKMEKVPRGEGGSGWLNRYSKTYELSFYRRYLQKKGDGGWLRYGKQKTYEFEITIWIIYISGREGGYRVKGDMNKRGMPPWIENWIYVGLIVGGRGRGGCRKERGGGRVLFSKGLLTLESFALEGNYLAVNVDKNLILGRSCFTISTYYLPLNPIITELFK